MSNFKKKAVATLGVFAILGTSLFTSALGAGTEIKGKIANMNIFNNGTKITVPADQQPILVNDRTYLPVRALGEAIGSDVKWDPAKPMEVQITTEESNVDEEEFNRLALEVNTNRIKMIEKDNKIADLEKQVKDLQEELKKKEETVGSSLSDFEKELNKDYGNYKNVRLDIKLRERSNDISVDININSRYYADWEKLYISDQEGLIQDVVRDLQREYRDTRIEGYLDGGSRAFSYDFYTDRNDRLQIDVVDDYDSGSSGDYRVLERDIISRYTEVRDIIIRKDESRKEFLAEVKLRLEPTRYPSRELNDLKGDIIYDIDLDLNKTLEYMIDVEFK